MNAYPPDVLRALVAIEALKHLNLKFGEQWRSLLTTCACSPFVVAHCQNTAALSASKSINKIVVPAADIIALVQPSPTRLVNSLNSPCYWP